MSARARGLVLGVDASNIRGGGGLNHLKEVLPAADARDFGFAEVVIWGSAASLAHVRARPWLVQRPVPALGGPMPARLAWQYLRLPRVARRDADLVFVPGGSFAGRGVPFVAMSQNILPFDAAERRRYGFGWERLRLWALGRAHPATFEAASGLVFLSEHARTVVGGRLRRLAPYRIVPHGLSPRFRVDPAARSHRTGTADAPLRLLYVSPVRAYKHPWNVVEAVARLRGEGLPLELDLVGKNDPRALARLQAALGRWDPARAFARYHGPVSYEDVVGFYHRADAFVFASSCENLPNIVLEAMAASLPIASSDRGPMPEVLGDAGLYFDPEDVGSIAAALRALAVDPELRARLSRRAYERSLGYSWERAAVDLYGFLAEVARGAATNGSGR